MYEQDTTAAGWRWTMAIRNTILTGSLATKTHSTFPAQIPSARNLERAMLVSVPLFMVVGKVWYVYNILLERS